MPKVSKRLRFEILRRDSHACRYCGAAAPDVKLVVDHVIPDALGGTTTPDNLATACEPCNSGKSSASPDATIVDDVAEGALRWARAMERAAQIKEEELLRQHDLDGEFLDIWIRYHVTDTGEELPLPDDWEGAVRRLRVAGLTERIFAEAVDVAMKAYGVRAENRFRYFCGVAWNMVTDLQKAAQDVVVGDDPRDKPAVFRDLDKELIATAVDHAMDNAGISMESWQYDELVGHLALRLTGRA